MTILRIAFRNDTEQARAIAARLHTRRTRTRQRRDEFSDLFARNHGHPELRAVRRLERGRHVIGVEWPREIPSPPGWRRSAEEPRCIVPAKTTTAGKTAAAELRRLTWPDHTEDLLTLGVPDPVYVDWGYGDSRGVTGHWLHAVVYAGDPDALWIAYPTRDVVDCPTLATIAAHGWETRPIEEFLQVTRTQADPYRPTSHRPPPRGQRAARQGHR